MQCSNGELVVHSQAAIIKKKMPLLGGNHWSMGPYLRSHTHTQTRELTENKSEVNFPKIRMTK